MDPDRPSGRPHAREMVRQSGLTSIAAAAGVASGLVLDVAIAASYGAGHSTDAFFVAARIPLGLVAILMVGANQALVPTISTWLIRRGETDTWRLTSILLVATAGIGAGLAAIAALAAQPLMRLTAPGLEASDVAVAASLARVLFLVVPLVAVAELLRALLNARYAFVTPAAMHLVMNAVAVALIVAFHEQGVFVIAWAYGAGALAQTLFMLLMSYRRGFRFHASIQLTDPAVVAAGRRCVRPLTGAGLNPLARVGEQLFVSYLPTGSITILNYGYRLISAIGGTVLFRSVIVTLLPRLTEATATNRKEELRSNVRLGIRIMLTMSIPLTALMAILAKPATIAVFWRGNFTQADAALLGAVLAVYSASLVGSAVQRAMLAPFYARLDTKTPLRNTFYGVAANLALVPPLVFAFGANSSRGVLGIAAAYSLAQYVNVTHAWYRMRRDTGVRLTRFTPVLLRLVLASLIMAAVLVAGYAALDLGEPMSRPMLMVKTVGVGLLGLVVLGAAMRLVDPSQFREAWRQVRSPRNGRSSAAYRRPVDNARAPGANAAEDDPEERSVSRRR